MNINDSYVYDGTEVKLTGRCAVSSRQKPGAKMHPEFTLVEIKPIDKDITWSKWVKQSELYVITKLDGQNLLMEN